MTEINENLEAKKSRKPLAFVAAGALVIALVGGGFAITANTKASPDATPSVTATTSADPSVTPVVTGTPQPTSEGIAYDELSKEEQSEADKLRAEYAANPLGVEDMQAVLDKADPRIGANFGMSKEQVDAAVLQTLNTYKELYSIKNLQGERLNDPADSVLIASQFSDKIAASYLPTLKAQMDKQAPFPTVNRDGSIGTINGVKYFPKASPAAGETVWTTTFSNDPVIYYTEIKDPKETDPTHGIQVKGERRDLILTEGGGAVESRCTFSVTSTRATGINFLLAGIGCNEQTIKVLTQGELDKRIADAREVTDASK